MKAGLSIHRALAVTGLGAAIVLSSCGRRDAGTTIKINGSDTMLQLGLAWQTAYKEVKPDIIISMNGEGSGVGLKALINGEIDLAHSSRPIQESEIKQIKEKFGKDPKEIIFGYDRLAVYVHKDNPINELTMEQLKGIFAEGGTIDDWSAIDPSMSGAIVRCSRSNTSGTYSFFKDAVCGKGVEFKSGATSMAGSAAAVDFVKTNKDAIGYSGMGYKTDGVKWLKITKDGSGCDPTGDNYPIARTLFAYTVGEPTGALKDYVDWCHGDAAQAILEKEKFIPMPADQRNK